MSQKIYISSTFRDLEGYRSKAKEALNFLAKYFSITRTMETMMPGSDDSVLRECLKDVGECDIYILIIGKLYGYIAPGTDFSFTQNEYNHAVSQGKLIIPLIADSEALGLEGIATENTGKFAAFTSLIDERHLHFVKKFVSPDHMVSQLLLALYPLAEKKWALGDYVKLRCDRRGQFLEFITRNYKDRLNSFFLIGKERDKPRYFLDRIATYEFGLTKGYLQYAMIPAEIVGPIHDYSLQKQKFIAHLAVSFIGADDIPSTFVECLQLITSKGIKCLFVQFHIHEIEARDPKTMSVLKKLWEEFDKACATVRLKAFFVMVFVFPNNSTLDINVLGKLKKTGIRLTTPLGLVTPNDIDNWLREHITTDIAQINKVLRFVFDGIDECDMQAVYEKMDDIKTIIN